MIFEAIIIGFIIGLVWETRNKAKVFKLSICEIWPTILGALLFYISLKMNKIIGTDWKGVFYIIHPLSLFLMAWGLVKGSKHIGKMVSSLGFFLNGLVVLFNKRMPVSLSALEKIKDGLTIELLLKDRVYTHKLMDQDKLALFSDIIPYRPFFGPAKVISIGDIFIALGFGILFASYIVFLFRREKNDRMD